MQCGPIFLGTIDKDGRERERAAKKSNKFTREVAEVYVLKLRRPSMLIDKKNHNEGLESRESLFKLGSSTKSMAQGAEE